MLKIRRARIMLSNAINSARSLDATFFFDGLDLPLLFSDQPRGALVSMVAFAEATRVWKFFTFSSACVGNGVVG